MLVVAALTIGVSSFVIGPKSASSQHLGFDLTSGSSSFTITSNIYPSPACNGSPALIYPGTPRCMVFSVHNNLSVPITVQSITSALDTTNYPAPPSDCTGTNLTLPTYSGSFSVPASGDADSPGVPVELDDNSSSQGDCQNLTYHFVYTGSARVHRLDHDGPDLGSEPFDLGGPGHLHGHGDAGQREHRREPALGHRELLHVPVRLTVPGHPARERDHRGGRQSDVLHVVARAGHHLRRGRLPRLGHRLLRLDLERDRPDGEPMTRTSRTRTVTPRPLGPCHLTMAAVVAP